jgi:hypothetical protein
MAVTSEPRLLLSFKTCPNWRGKADRLFRETQRAMPGATLCILQYTSHGQRRIGIFRRPTPRVSTAGMSRQKTDQIAKLRRESANELLARRLKASILEPVGTGYRKVNHTLDAEQAYTGRPQHVDSVDETWFGVGENKRAEATLDFNYDDISL